MLKSIENTDFRNNPFNEAFVLHLNTQDKKNDFINYLKEILIKDKDFYAKIIEIISLCSAVKIDGLEDVNGGEHPFYMDRII